MRTRKILLLFLICFTAQLFSAPTELKITDVRSSMEELFNYHVEFKELTPQIVQRSFKLYLEQFDPDKLYLLKEETQPFLELQPEQVASIIEKYQEDNFSDYLALSQLIQKAILRSRILRKEIQEEIVQKEPIQPVSQEYYADYASSERQLKERIKKHLDVFLFAEMGASSPSLPQEKKEKICALWKRRVERGEQSYLILDKQGKLLGKSLCEHFFSLHILKAFAKSLDAHTNYFSPEEAFEMRTSLEKQFEGIGVVLREGVDGVVITGLLKEGPAEKNGGISSGDLLVSVDGKSLINTPYEEILEKLKGDQGQRIRLGLKRKERLFYVELTREKILMQDERLKYAFEPYGNGIIGKLDLPSFYESGQESSCEKDMRQAIKELKKKGSLLGLIIDMRENSGGFLNQAVKVAGLFITSGVIVISKYAAGEVKYLRDVDGRVYFNGPVVILTSKASASAAEIVAQALQDYGAAVIVGDERTYGKGTIQFQTVTDEDAKAFFKVTVGRYYTVSGKSTQIEGVKADIVVPTDYFGYNIGERFLEFPLTNDQVSAAYIDPLTDVDANSQQWLKKNYLPNIQKKKTLWQKMLPFLRGNSANRLESNPNFKAFLQWSDPAKKKTRSSSDKVSWGVEDLQMGEAVNILKDMIVLEPSPT